MASSHSVFATVFTSQTAPCASGVSLMWGLSVQASSLGPGCTYWLQKNSGLSVGISGAEYCLNRNSCAALYPDVANRACACVWGRWGGLSRVLDCLGRVVELSRSSACMKLISISLSWAIVLIQRLFFRLSARNNEYAAKEEKKKWSQTRYELKW